MSSFRYAVASASSSADSSSIGCANTAVEAPWYGVRTRSNQERVVVTALEARGYQPYLPIYSRRHRSPRRVVTSNRALFPGYVFCRFDAGQRIPILSTPGVVSILGFGLEPAPIDDREIEKIRAILRSGLPAEPWPFFREGQQVRITYGALEGLEGILLKRKSDWRLVVSVVMLQRSVSVEIDRDWAIPI